jgi:23S rRNA (adenine-N6)-dimethyltransferase
VSEPAAQHVRAGARRAPGRHLLTRRVVAELVADACVGVGEVVVDVGAGTGHITAELRRGGARVTAIELDARFAAALRRRFAGDDEVTVVEADARRAPLPREPYRVVANLPFAGSGAILDRLLDPRGALTQADLVLEWGAARKRCEVWPATCRGVVTSAFFRVWIERRVPAACFEPRPSVDAAVLVAQRRQQPRVAPADAAAFAGFVRAGFATPRLADGLHDHVCPRRLRRLADSLGFPRDAAPRALDGRQWVALFAETRPSGAAGGPAGRRPARAPSRSC